MLRQIESHRGFTLIELVISLIMGLVVLTASVSFAVTTMRSVAGNEIRENVQRNARFIALSFPTAASVSNIPGLADPPVTATRKG